MLDIFHKQNDTDAEKFKNEVFNVLTQTEIDKYSETEISTNHIFSAPHGYFSNRGNFAHKPATYYFSLYFDAHDQFFSKNATWQVIYASSDLLFFNLQVIREKVHLQRCLKLFMTHFQPTLFRRMFGIHHKKTDLQKVIYSIF